jgi:hypothetical protein
VRARRARFRRPRRHATGRRRPHAAAARRGAGADQRQRRLHAAAQGPGAPSPLSINGYVDVGFAKAQGDGTSFAPGDTRVPLDYGVDTFAPAVNSRGDVASTDPGPGRTVNGFVPRSAGIGGRPSFLLNTLNVDLKYVTPGAPLMVFSRVQFLPRFMGDAGEATRVVVEQAFGRLVPFDSQEMALSVGKFDSVFGIEYLDNQANIRTGITPSLIARYTTGQSIGAKAFYRIQIAPLSSALSLNVAATNSGNFVEALQPPDASLTGAPVGSGRLGYELNAAGLQAKLGVSACTDRATTNPIASARQRARRRPARRGRRRLPERRIHPRRGDDGGPKTTGAGAFPFASGFHARGGYAPARVRAVARPRAAAQADRLRALRSAPRLVRGLHADHGRSDHRRRPAGSLGGADPEGRVSRQPRAGRRADRGNNVFTSSLVYSW